MILWSQVTPPQNDTLSQYSLDAVGRLTGASNTVTPATVGATPFTDTLAYGYDANGNRQSMSWDANAGQYAYSANRLTQSTGADNKTYTWDGAGRMTGTKSHGVRSS